MPELRAALDLRDGGGHVPEGRGHHREQPIRIRGRPLQEEVVVGAHAREHELRLLQPQEGPGAEAAHVGIEDLGMDPLLIEVGEASLGRVRPRRKIVHGVGAVGEGPVEAGDGGDPDGQEGLAAHEPDVLAALSLDVRDGVAPLARHPRGPDVGGLRDVAVGVDHAVAVEEVAHGECLRPG